MSFVASAGFRPRFSPAEAGFLVPYDLFQPDEQPAVERHRSKGRTDGVHTALLRAFGHQAARPLLHDGVQENDFRRHSWTRQRGVIPTPAILAVGGEKRSGYRIPIATRAPFMERRPPDRRAARR